MKILVTGRDGQVGWELERVLQPLGTVVAVDRAKMDLRSADAICSIIRETKPGVIVNAAAYTAVDQAESEPEIAMAVNGIAPGILAEEAKQAGALLIHYSTDYVFDGAKQEPYVETDTPNPLSVYGKTKLAGEQAIHAVGSAHLVLRTSWVYGTRGRNFLLTIQGLAKERDKLDVVDDQIGAPTWCRSIARTTEEILSALWSRRASSAAPDIRGVYHMTASGETSWCGFARAIVSELAKEDGASDRIRLLPSSIKPIPTEAYPLPAPRPRNSRLSNQRLIDTFGTAIADWRSELETCLAERNQTARSEYSAITESTD